MRNRRFVAILFALTLAFGLGELNAQMTGQGRVGGTIRDQSGKPIEGVKVSAQAEAGGSPLEALSDKKGEWAILGFRSGKYTFTVSKEGYTPETATAPVQQMQRNPRLDFVLKQATKGAVLGTEKLGGLLSEGNALVQQKQYPEALAKFQQILTESPTLYQVRLNIGNVYKAQGESEKALAEYQAVLAEDPGDVGALVQSGDILLKQGKLTEAVTFFEKAVASSPNDEALAFNVAEIYFSTQNVDKALEYYEKAATIKPDWPDPVLKIGFAHLNKGDMEKAKAQMEKVIAMAPDSPQAQTAKGILDSLK